MRLRSRRVTVPIPAGTLGVCQSCRSRFTRHFEASLSEAKRAIVLKDHEMKAADQHPAANRDLLETRSRLAFFLDVVMRLHGLSHPHAAGTNAKVDADTIFAGQHGFHGLISNS